MLLKKFYRTLIKSNITQRGYNKFLTVIGNDELDSKKIEEDRRWDGLKGYITNTDIYTCEVIMLTTIEIKTRNKAYVS